MPIQARVEMLGTGALTLAVQVFAAQRIYSGQLCGLNRRLKPMGSRSVFAERTFGGNYVDIDIDRTSALRWGVQSSQLMDSRSAVIGGLRVGTFWDGRARHQSPSVPKRLSIRQHRHQKCMGREYAGRGTAFGSCDACLQ